MPLQLTYAAVLPVLLSFALLCTSTSVIGGLSNVFSYPDAATAREHWTPQFGSLPVRVETLDDGSTCLALDASFEAHGDHACWDCHVPMDLSDAAFVSFDFAAVNGGLA